LETEYEPSGPYVFKTGKYAKKALEMLMFSPRGYRFLYWLLRKLNQKAGNGERNELHKHIAWLIQKGKSRIATKICPYCHVNPVQYFSVFLNREYGGIGSFGPLCCGKEECLEKAESEDPMAIPALYHLDFSSLTRFSSTDAKDVVRLFREVFGLQGRLTKKEAFRFFKKEVAMKPAS